MRRNLYQKSLNQNKPIKKKILIKPKQTDEASKKHIIRFKRSFWNTVLNERNATEKSIIHYTQTYAASRAEHPLKEDYPKRYITKATENILSLLRHASDIYDADTDIATLIKLILPVFNQQFLTPEKAFTLDDIKMLLRQKKFNSNERNQQDNQVRFFELMAIIITYIVKKDLKGSSCPKIAMQYLHPELNLEAALFEMGDLIKYNPYNPKSTNATTLSNLPGRGISYPFTGHERGKVGKSNIFLRADGKIFTGNLLKRESAYTLLTFSDIRTWSQFRVDLRATLKLLLQDKQNQNGDYFHSKSIRQVLQLTMKWHRHLVQDFSPGAAKQVALECMLPYQKTDKPRIAIDPCAGWGDRLLGFASTNMFHQIIANDTNTNLTPLYSNMIKTLCPFQENLVTATSFPAETLTTENLRLKQPIDFMMTSPPYFSIEAYQGDNTSHQVHSTYQAWKVGFLDKLAYRMSALMREGAYACMQVSDIGCDNIQTKTKVQIPLVKNTIKAFEQAGFSLEKSMPYASSNLKLTNNKQNTKNNTKTGETVLFFKRQPKLYTEITEHSENQGIAPKH